MELVFFEVYFDRLIVHKLRYCSSYFPWKAHERSEIDWRSDFRHLQCRGKAYGTNSGHPMDKGQGQGQWHVHARSFQLSIQLLPFLSLNHLIKGEGVSLLDAMTLNPQFFKFRRIRAKITPVHVLKVYWTVAIWWWEYGTFVWSIAWCRWPGETTAESSRILIIADTQVPRPFHGWLPSLTWFKTYIINHNLRKSWHAAKSLRPQAILFLGDMLRHGSKTSDMDEWVRPRTLHLVFWRFMSNRRYVDYANHFHAIFKAPSTIPKLFVPGNRDVG